MVSGMLLSACGQVGGRQLASTLSGFVDPGLAKLRRGDYEGALQYWTAALQRANANQDLRSASYYLTNLGVAQSELGHYDAALGNLKKALAIDQRLRDKKGESIDLLRIGIVHSSRGEYELALEVLERALAIARSSKQRGGEGTILNVIGTVHADLGQYEEAIGYYTQTLAINRELGHRAGEGTPLHNIGLAYLHLGRYAEAQRHIEEALAIYREFAGVTETLTPLLNLGEVLRRRGQQEAGILRLEDALALSRKSGRKLQEGAALNELGFLLSDRGEARRSEEYHRAALAAFKRIGAQDYIWRALRGMAMTNARIAGERAIDYYEEALSVIESLRGKVVTETAKLSYVANKLEVYDELIGALVARHRTAPDRGYDRKALEIFERKQGRAFLEQLGRTGARHFAGLPAGVERLERELDERASQIEAALVRERSELTGERDDDHVRRLEQRLRGLAAQQQTLRSEIELRYRGYAALKYPRPASVKELQSVLALDEAMLIYAIMPNETILWAVSRDAFGMFPLSVGEEEIRRLIDAVLVGPVGMLGAVYQAKTMMELEPIMGAPLKRFAIASHQAFRSLIPDKASSVIGRAKNLYVVPTGPLYQLPWEALVVEVGRDSADHRYLIENHAVAYLASASQLKVLREGEAGRKGKPRYPLLAFANPVYAKAEVSRSSRLSGDRADDTGRLDQIRTRAYRESFGGGEFRELPDTEEEVRAIAALLHAPPESEPLQLRERASRNSVLRLSEVGQLEQYRYVVFATHALLPNEVGNLNLPALVLSHPTQEGYLTMADVLGLRLRADAIILSACNTGRGNQVKGEGVIGLTRAFMYAGAGSVSVTLWPVESRSAAAINVERFRGLSAGMSHFEALRRAKLLMLGNENRVLRHPFFWAPVVVYGKAQ